MPLDSVYFDHIQNLIIKLKNSNHEVRKRSAIELGKIGSIRAVPALIREIYRECYFKKIGKIDHDISDFYFQALSRIGPQSTHYLVLELLDSPSIIFNRFIRILNDFSIIDDRGFKTLYNLIKNDEDEFFIINTILIWILLKEKKCFNYIKTYLNSNSIEVFRISILYFLQFEEIGIKVLEIELESELNQNLSSVHPDKIKKGSRKEIIIQLKDILKKNRAKNNNLIRE